MERDLETGTTWLPYQQQVQDRGNLRLPLYSISEHWQEIGGFLPFHPAVKVSEDLAEKDLLLSGKVHP